MLVVGLYTMHNWKVPLAWYSNARVYTLPVGEVRRKEKEKDSGMNATSLEELTILKADVGAVIGQGGKTIRSIEQKSGASVKVDGDALRVVIS
eukprot:Cvel_35481.t1-p1 / transcript=Cvel_35481.t1 / gene=Cvel_35481 / organism=Chromera_velia_CCMP2878 / gene_product=Polyribonucleotide nucleotidyltransferase, putative / transcript_product=Polyribonucleotide nucleotidyltransferase, putative / location=Cvel_scaffold6499:123-698(-) / protein_length=92 / sequence_SO=supercontig / SO=protein_coding / is_pseudo=false